MSRAGWKDDGWGGGMVDLICDFGKLFLEAEIEARWLWYLVAYCRLAGVCIHDMIRGSEE